MKTRVTQKQIKEQYSPSEIIAVTRKTKITTKEADICDFATLAEIIEYFKGHDPIDIKVGSPWYDQPGSFCVDIEVEKDEVERYNEGVRILQQREQSKIDKRLKEEKEYQELLRLEKKFQKK